MSAVRGQKDGYRSRDNLTAVTDALAPALSESFSYTARGHLAGATGPYGAFGFTYDGTGNRLSHSLDAGGGAQVDSYAYPAGSNRLASVTLGAGGTRSLGYDAAGNVVSDSRAGGPYGYSYDAAGRLASVTVGGVVQAEYKYNALGQQAIRSFPASGLSIHSVYGPDGNRIAEFDAGSGALIREYVWFEGAPIAVIEGGVVYYVRSDHIGRPVFATTSAGTVVWTASYLPFGGVHVTSGAPIEARFPGQWFQMESGLHQNWMRDYDPTTGRYIEPDPLGLVDGASVYGYARQSPLRWTDPRGEYGVGGAVAGAIGGAISGGTAAYLSSDGCLTAAVVGGAAGATVGAVAGLLTTGASATANAGAAAVAQILSNELACYCEKQRQSVAAILASPSFYFTTLGAGIGSYSGSGFAAAAGRGATTRFMGSRPPYQGALAGRAEIVESFVTEAAGGLFSGMGEFVGSTLGDLVDR